MGLRFEAKEPRRIGEGRLAERARERQDAVEGRQKHRRGQTHPLPQRAGPRATLVERNNPEEFLEFHWDPSSYSINKVGRWSSDTVEGGTDVFNWSGSSPTIITFDAFFDEVDARRELQRSAEDSLGWLFNRLRSREEKFAAPRFGKYSRTREKWLNIRDPEAQRPPPIMVFFGLRDGFECVLTSARIKTGFQAPPFPDDPSQAANQHASRFGPEGSPRFTEARAVFIKNFELKARAEDAWAIRRATVGIELKEYVNPPAV